MTLYQLEITLSVAKHLSFSAAAKEYHISQSAVSQQLKHLKEEYGVILFKKKGRGGLNSRRRGSFSLRMPSLS